MTGRLLIADESQRRARDRATFAAWGSRLSPEQYLDREDRLRATAHARAGMRTWLWELEDGTLAASCETFRLPLQPQGAVEVVASVFVEPALRRAGHAGAMMQELAKSRRDAGLDALVLFSEVGPRLYARVGFEPVPAPGRVSPAAGSTGGVRSILPGDLPEVLARRARLRAGAVDLQLTADLLDWHFERSRFYAHTLGLTLPPAVGAQSDDVLVLWTPDYRAGLLRLLDATGPAGASLDHVLDAAGATARAAGLRGVELWDDPHSLLLNGGAHAMHEDDQPMILPFTETGRALRRPLSRAFWA